MADRVPAAEPVESPADDAAPVEQIQSVIEAALSEDPRAILVALRDRVARAISNPNCNETALAALSRRLMDISREIKEYDTRAAEETEEDGPSPNEEWDAEAI